MKFHARHFFALVLGIVGASVACSSSSPATGSSPTDTIDPGHTVNPGDDTGGSKGDASADANTRDAATIAPLACDTITWCTTYDVKLFRGDVAAPAGGTLTDGVYRLEYAMEPANVNPDGTSEYSELIVISGGQFMATDNGGLGTLGTFASSGTNLAFTGVTACGNFGVTEGAQPLNYSLPYTATPDGLTLFDTVTPLGADAGAPWTLAKVYKKVTGSLCDQGTKDPATADDSYYCRVNNCVCVESKGATIAPASCPFIHVGP